MKKFVQCLKAFPTAFRVVFIVSWLFTIGLFTASFLVPPLGIIDASVLKGSAVVLGYVAVFMVFVVVIAGRSATFEHGETRVTIGGHGDGND